MRVVAYEIRRGRDFFAAPGGSNATSSSATRRSTATTSAARSTSTGLPPAHPVGRPARDPHRPVRPHDVRLGQKKASRRGAGSGMSPRRSRRSSRCPGMPSPTWISTARSCSSGCRSSVRTISCRTTTSEAERSRPVVPPWTILPTPWSIRRKLPRRGRRAGAVRA